MANIEPLVNLVYKNPAAGFVVHLLHSLESLQLSELCFSFKVLINSFTPLIGLVTLSFKVEEK